MQFSHITGSIYISQNNDSATFLRYFLTLTEKGQKYQPDMRLVPTFFSSSILVRERKMPLEAETNEKEIRVPFDGRKN